MKLVDPRAKGARGETQVRDIFRKHSSLQFERVPGSGALDEKHGMKGDIYVPNEKNLYAIEVKNYEEDSLYSSILINKDPQLLKFWEQAIRQGLQTNKKPLLVYKYNRSKMYVCFPEFPTKDYNYLFASISGYEFYIAELETWLTNEIPKFIA